MSRYFNTPDWPAEAPLPEPEVDPREVTYQGNLDKAVRKITNELTLIAAGQSRYYNGAIQLNPENDPVYRTLDIMQKVKSEFAVDCFLKAAAQDINRSVSKTFRAWLEEERDAEE